MKIEKNRVVPKILWLLCALLLPLSMPAQQVTQKPTSAIKLDENVTLFVRDYKLDSKLMARQMPYNLVLPNGYDSEKSKSVNYPVIYLLHGLTGHYNNWAEKTKLSEYAAKYNFIIVMPEGNNGWYSDSLAVPSDKYESYIVRELVPEIDKRFRTIADRDHRAIAGLSMGGYGSIKFGLKHSEMFTLVGSFSGALGAASFTEKTTGAIGKSIDQIFGAEAGDNRNGNDIFKIVREMPDDKIKNLPFVYLDCGTEDFLFKNNRDFVNLLVEKKVKHEFRQLPGAHDWKFWDSQIKEFLEVSDNFLNRAKVKP